MTLRRSPRQDPCGFIDRKSLLKTLKDLISIRSVNPSLIPGERGEKEIGEYLYRRLRKLGLETVQQTVTSDRANIIGILRGRGKGKTLLLNGHMDTVGLEGMSIDPLKGELKQGNIYGRGSADMKSGIAAILSACEAIGSAGVVPHGDVLVALVVDEEYKSIGTEKLLERYRADAAVVCEPTDLKIGVAHKGFAWAEVEVVGKAAHGSRPLEGIDAITKAGKFLLALEGHSQTNLGNKSHPLLGSPSVHASLIERGKELSTYPDRCRISLERRTIPGEDQRIFEGELREIIKEIRTEDKAFEAGHKLLFSRPPFEISQDQDIVRILKRCYEETLDQPSEAAGISWWMDSALFSAAGIPTLAFGPAGFGLHGAVESVEFESVCKTAAVLAETILEFCR